MQSNLSKVSFFLYVFSYNYIWLRILLFPILYNTYGSMAFFYAVVLCLSLTFILYLFPKKIFKFNYVEQYKKSFFKHICNLLLAVESFVGISMCAILITHIFISDAEPIPIIIGFCLIISILSKLKTSDVIQISTWFTLLGFFLIIISFSYFISIDATMILPFKTITWFTIPFYVLVILGDNVTLLLLDKEQFKSSKSIYVIPIVVAMLSFSFELFMLLCSAGSELFKDLPWVGFICLSIQPVTRYIGNFDFAYIYCIIICCIFKYSFNWSVIRNSFKKIRKWEPYLTGILLVTGTILAYFFIPVSSEVLRWLCFILIAGLLLLLWMFKEVYYVSRNKKE